MKLIHATTWTNPKNIMLSETGQIQKDKYCTIPVIRSTQNGQTPRDNVVEITRHSEEEGMGSYLMGTGA